MRRLFHPRLWFTPYADVRIIRSRWQKAIHRLSWVYLVALIGFWAYLRVRGDRTWLGTVILFGPHWIALTPLAILVPAALLMDRRSLRALAVAASIAMVPIMGFCVPWRKAFAAPAKGQHLRLLTCNINGASLNHELFEELVDRERPDVVVLQECFSPRRPAFLTRDWDWRNEGELLIASRFPITSAQSFSRPEWEEWGGAVFRFELDAPGGAVHLFNIHLASPHLQFQAIIDGKPEGGHELENHLDVRREQSRVVTELARQWEPAPILAGDFNSIAEGSIFRDNWQGLSDGFRCAGLGVGHTYFGQGAAVRIDHVLAGSDWIFESCRVGPDVGSPHRPVIADLRRRQ